MAKVREVFLLRLSQPDNRLSKFAAIRLKIFKANFWTNMLENSAAMEFLNVTQCDLACLFIVVLAKTVPQAITFFVKALVALKELVYNLATCLPLTTVIIPFTVVTIRWSHILLLDFP